MDLVGQAWTRAGEYGQYTRWRLDAPVRLVPGARLVWDAS